jgi:hypothetical protein
MAPSEQFHAAGTDEEVEPQPEPLNLIPRDWFEVATFVVFSVSRCGF